MSKVAAAVGVETYSVWESTAPLRLIGGVRGAWAPTGEERGGGLLCRHAHSLLRRVDQSDFCMMMLSLSVVMAVF